MSRLILLVPLSLLLSACLLGDVKTTMNPTVSGTLTVTQPDGVQSQWTPDRCASGAIEYFVGFDFVSSANSGQLRALLDPINGALVRWKIDAARTVVFRNDDCTKLDLDVQPTPWRVNDVREFAGHIDLQCRSSNGLRIEGKLSVDHCH
jgi:hypothetical protein